MYKLTRERDNLTKVGKAIKYIEWNEQGRVSNSYDEPAIGRSLILDPQYVVYTWLTTEITSFTNEDGVLKFSTKNSNYIMETIEPQ
jgi:hypothetical protein